MQTVADLVAEVVDEPACPLASEEVIDLPKQVVQPPLLSLHDYKVGESSLPVGSRFLFVSGAIKKKKKKVTTDQFIFSVVRHGYRIQVQDNFSGGVMGSDRHS